MKDVYSDRIWKKWYNSRVSRKLKYPSISAASFIEQAINKYPERIALHYMDTCITYRELNDYSNQFANFLNKSGVKKGDVVGLNALNIPSYYIAILGILKAGCIITGVSPLLTPSELEFQLNDCGAKLLLTMDFLRENVKQAINKTNVTTVIMSSLSDFQSNATEIPDSMLQEMPEKSAYRFTDIIKEMPTQSTKEKIDPDAICWIQYTGGTTGRSKGATWTNRDVVSYVVRFANWIDVRAGEEVLLTPFPLFVGAGMLNTLVAYANAMTQVAVPNPRDLDFLVAAMKKYKPNIITGVPTIWLGLMKKPEFCEWDFSNTRMCISGAAPFPGEYFQRFEKIIGTGKLFEAYGMSETGLIVSTPPAKYKVGSIGVPITDTDIQIIDTVTKKPVPLGEVGEIAVKGPSMFSKGYYNKPEETANIIRDGWLCTGDLAKMDEDGFIFIADRLKDMVNVSGYKVFTQELDDVIMGHPDVDLAASIGISDPKRPGSERVASVIVLKPGIARDNAEKDKLLSYLKEKVAPFKVPKVIEFMDQLPLSAAGKILKRELRETLGKKLNVN